MRSTLDTVATAAIIVSALAVGFAAVQRTLASPTQVRGVDRDVEPRLLAESEWRSVRDAGVLVGDSLAPVTIAVFSDLECPFCARFHATMRQAESLFGGELAYVFVHYPLNTHRFARPAARAAECAGRFGSFGNYIDQIFEKQDSMGLKSWLSYAADAGVQDTLRFRDCVEGTNRMPRIERGRELGDSLGIESTPTVLINGWRLGRAPYENLRPVIDDILRNTGDFHGGPK